MAANWGSLQDLGSLTSLTTTEQFFTEIDLSSDPTQWAHAEVEYDPPSSPTDKLIVSVYTSLDDSGENWDDQPIMSFVIDNTPDPNKRSFTLADFYKYRIGVKMDGATDTTGTVNAAYRVATPT